jgi:uncharacterized phage-associated protein
VEHIPRCPIRIAFGPARGGHLMYDARDVANFVLDSAESRNLPLSNLALQKLLYFIHGWFFSLYDQPLIKNKFEAWEYGPVQRVLYNQFKACKNAPIRGMRATHLDPLTGENIYRTPVIDNDHAVVIESILDKYERYTVGQLVEESHVEDGPWEFVWRQAEEAIYPGMKIPDSLIADHFKRLGPILTIH